MTYMKIYTYNMPHLYMNAAYVLQMRDSCNSYMNAACHIYEWMQHVTYMNHIYDSYMDAACHIYEIYIYNMPHLYMNAAYMLHSHMNAACHIYEWAMSGTETFVVGSKETFESFWECLPFRRDALIPPASHHLDDLRPVSHTHHEWHDSYCEWHDTFIIFQIYENDWLIPPFSHETRVTWLIIWVIWLIEQLFVYVTWLFHHLSYTRHDSFIHVT